MNETELDILNGVFYEHATYACGLIGLFISVIGLGIYCFRQSYTDKTSWAIATLVFGGIVGGFAVYEISRAIKPIVAPISALKEHGIFHPPQ